jgi:hypothetical protein
MVIRELLRKAIVLSLLLFDGEEGLHPLQRLGVGIPKGGSLMSYRRLLISLYYQWLAGCHFGLATP